MFRKFKNGIKFLLLFLLTNASARNYPDQRQLNREDNKQQQARNWDWYQPYYDQDQTERKSDILQVLKNQADQSKKDQSSKSKLKHSDRGAVQIIDQPAWDRSDQSNSDKSFKQQTDGDNVSFLDRLLQSRKGPVVVFLTPGSDLDLDLAKALKPADTEVAEAEEDTNQVYVPQPGESNAYVLYNVLKSTQQEEDLDPEANQVFEKTKDILRSAFALRCGARNTCEKKCPQKKKPQCENKCQKKEDKCKQQKDECEQKEENKCENKCQKIYDELDACSKQKKSKWGKTMPPNWLLRQRL